MKVRQVMTREVIAVGPDETVEEVARLLLRHRIGSVPVVDEGRRVVGFVGEDDLFLKEKGIPFSLVKAPSLFSQWVSPDRLAEIYRQSRHHRASDVMTRHVVCADADEEVGRVAELMLERNLKKLPVVEDGRLVGVVSRADMLKLLVTEPSAAPAAAGVSLAGAVGERAR
jgi:CBS domain-containing protein